MRDEGGEKGKHVRGKGRDQNHSSYRRKIADLGPREIMLFIGKPKGRSMMISNAGSSGT